MNRRAIVHIGTEKTGTTTLQLFLKKNRSRLLERGFIYPRFCGDINQTGLAAYAMEDGRRDDIRDRYGVHTASDVAGFRARMQSAARLELAGNHTAVFCNEHCHSRLVHPSEIQRLKEFLSDHFDDIQIVIYLRRQDQLAASLYTTRIKSGGTDPKLLPDASPNSPYFNYDLSLRMWEDVFGLGNITARLFNREDLVGGSIISDFLTVWDLGRPEEFAPVGDQNESLLPKAQEFLRRINCHAKSLGEAPNNAPLGPLVTMLTSNFAGQGVRPSRADAERFYMQYRSGNIEVARRYFDGKDPLFREVFDSYPEVADPTEITLEDCAEIAARLYEASQQHIRRLEAEISIRDALLKWERGDKEGGLAELRAAARRFARHAPVFRSLAELQVRQKDYKEAAKAAARAAALDPNSVEYHHFLGFTLRNSGQLADAEQAWRKALALDPDHGGIRRALGDLMHAMAEEARETEKERLACD